MALNSRRIALGAAAAVSLAGFAIGIPSRGPVVTFVRAWAQPAQSGATSVTAAGITLHSVSVELPVSEKMFPGGAEAEAINNTCLACHSAGMVLNQPALTQAAWQAEVEKMRAQYKAPVAPEDEPAIVAYLMAHKGAK
jgi:hypothetical protein